MSSTLFEIQISADGHTLSIEIEIPKKVDDNALDKLFSQLFQAFDEVTPNVASRQQIRKSLSYAGGAHCRKLRLQRPYTDPQYPVRFEQVLRRLSGSAPTLH